MPTNLFPYMMILWVPLFSHRRLFYWCFWSFFLCDIFRAFRFREFSFSSLEFIRPPCFIKFLALSRSGFGVRIRALPNPNPCVSSFQQQA